MTSVLHGFIWSKCVSNDRCNYSVCRSPIKRVRFSLTSPDVSLELQIWHLQTIQKSLKGGAFCNSAKSLKKTLK